MSERMIVIQILKENMFIRNGLFLCLFCLVVQSCTTYSVLPKNIGNYNNIEGFYSNTPEIDTLKIDDVFYHWFLTETIWNMFDRKREIKADSIYVFIEIVNSKRLKFSFFRGNENIGMKLLKGKFKEDNCFYTRRRFYVIPALPLFFWYENSQKRIYRTNNELVIEMAYSGGGAFIIYLESWDNYHRIWKFKRGI